MQANDTAGDILAAGDTVAAWATENPRSAALSARARRLLPGGVTHDVRLAEPFPLAVARAAGSRSKRRPSPVPWPWPRSPGPPAIWSICPRPARSSRCAWPGARVGPASSPRSACTTCCPGPRFPALPKEGGADARFGRRPRGVRPGWRDSPRRRRVRRWHRPQRLCGLQGAWPAARRHAARPADRVGRRAHAGSAWPFPGRERAPRAVRALKPRGIRPNSSHLPSTRASPVVRIARVRASRYATR
jgi:hypothetical protein